MKTKSKVSPQPWTKSGRYYIHDADGETVAEFALKNDRDWMFLSSAASEAMLAAIIRINEIMKDASATPRSIELEVQNLIDTANALVEKTRKYEISESRRETKETP